MSVTRRTVLRGLGASIALPWMESLAGSTPVARAAGAPQRVVFYYFPVGMVPADFRPSGTGATWVASPILEPVDDLRDQLLVVRGLTNVDATPGQELALDPHAFLTPSTLTGEYLALDEIVGRHGGRSADQLLADRLGQGALFRSLELTSEPSALCEPGVPCALRRHVSWDGPGQPRTREGNPRLLFERLFGDLVTPESGEARARRIRRRQSVLDAVLDDASRLQTKLSGADRGRLDAYLTGIHEVEDRLYAVADAGACGDDALAWANATELEGVVDADEHVRIMNDLMRFALSCDRTRVITYMISNEATFRSYPHLGITNSHHPISHLLENPDNVQALREICRWEMARFGDFVRSLAAEDGPGGGSLLDDTLVVGFGAMGDPDSHDPRDLPVVLAGGGGGVIRPGRVIDADDVPFANLITSVLQGFGVDTPDFGREGTGPMGGLR